MSYDVERALITRILEENDIRSVIRQKLTAKFFEDDDIREVYTWLVNHYQQYGRVASLGFLQREFPDFEPIDTDDDLIALVEEVKRTKLYNDMSVAVKKISDATIEDPETGFNLMRKVASDLTVLHSSAGDSDITKEVDEIAQDYENRKFGKGVTGIEYPWPYLNSVTLGMHPGELIAFYARPKSLKTFVSLAITDYVHQQYGIVPVYFSCEMPKEQIRNRMAAIRAKIPYKAFRAGNLTEEEEVRFLDALEEIRESPPFFLCSIDSVGTAAITEIKSKSQEYDAQLVVVDGAYFLMEEESHRSFRVITRGLKKSVAESLGIPCLLTTQANRASEKNRSGTSGVSFGDSLAQDCDQLIQIIRDDQHREQKELMFTLPALRESEGGTMLINAIPCTDFSQKAFEAVEEEDDDDIEDDEDDFISD